jgi:signal transduction histidine kinase
MIDKARQVGFHVDRHSFELLPSLKFEIDHELVEQAIMNLLDNAAKYSFRDTTVNIYAAVTRAGGLRITVSNTGLPIKRDDVPLCVQRGWRSPEARKAIGEGSGIGLWIVDNIMRVHGGQLVVTPTTAEGLTEISLIFRRTTEVRSRG